MAICITRKIPLAKTSALNSVRFWRTPRNLQKEGVLSVTSKDSFEGVFEVHEALCRDQGVPLQQSLDDLQTFLVSSASQFHPSMGESATVENQAIEYLKKQFKLFHIQVMEIEQGAEILYVLTAIPLPDSSVES